MVAKLSEVTSATACILMFAGRANARELARFPRNRTVLGLCARHAWSLWKCWLINVAHCSCSGELLFGKAYTVLAANRQEIAAEMFAICQRLRLRPRPNSIFRPKLGNLNCDESWWRRRRLLSAYMGT